MGKNRIFFTLGIMAMFISLFSVSCTSGKNETSDTELKQLLSQAIEGIESLEKENTSLKAKIDKPTKGNITRANKAVVEDLKKAQDENARIKAEAEKLKGIVSGLKSQITAKEAKENKQITVLHKEISKLKGMLSFSRLQLESKQEEENIRITELKKDNNELYEIISKIHNLTTDQQPAVNAKPEK